MKPFCISVSAEKDLKQIWRYTAQHYGRLQADLYTNVLLLGCQKIAQQPLVFRSLRLANQDFRVYRYKNHYILYLVADDKVVIVAFFHERMDIMVRLRARLENS